MDDLTPLERAVLDYMVTGEDPIFAALLTQAKAVVVVDREWHGDAGFATEIEVPEELALPTRAGFEISDVVAQIEGMTRGVIFALFVRDGRMVVLEGTSFDEEWPEPVRTFRLSYLEEPRRLLLPGFGPQSMAGGFDLRSDWDIELTADGRLVTTRYETPLWLWLLDRWFRMPDFLLDYIERRWPRLSPVMGVPCRLYSRWYAELVTHRRVTLQG